MEFVLGGIRLPLTPERVTLTGDGKVQSWNIIDLGEVAFVRGRQPKKVSFECILPGAGRTVLSVVRSWQSPLAIANQIEQWRDSGATVRFLVTETPINLDVFVESFEYNARGGFGDLECRLSLTEARAVRISTVGTTPSATGAGTPINPYREGRPQPATPSSYTVKSGDSLWAIAKQTLGDGSRWPEIYAANPGIGPDPNLIQAGAEIAIPGAS